MPRLTLSQSGGCKQGPEAVGTSEAGNGAERSLELQFPLPSNAAEGVAPATTPVAAALGGCEKSLGLAKTKGVVPSVDPTTAEEESSWGANGALLQTAEETGRTALGCAAQKAIPGLGLLGTNSSAFFVSAVSAATAVREGCSKQCSCRHREEGVVDECRKSGLQPLDMAEKAHTRQPSCGDGGQGVSRHRRETSGAEGGEQTNAPSLKANQQGREELRSL